MNAAAVDHSPAPNCTETGNDVQQRARPKTMQPRGHLTRAERRAAGLVPYPGDVERPRTRGDCKDGPRPCPFVSCAHHLYLDVSEFGSVKLNHPHLEVDQLAETCALDVADRGGVTLDEVGDLLNVSRQRVQQVQAHIFGKLAAATNDG